MRASAGGSKTPTALVLWQRSSIRAYHCQDTAACGLAGGSFVNPKRNARCTTHTLSHATVKRAPRIPRARHRRPRSLTRSCSVCSRSRNERDPTWLPGRCARICVKNMRKISRGCPFRVALPEMVGELGRKKSRGARVWKLTSETRWSPECSRTSIRQSTRSGFEPTRLVFSRIYHANE